MITISKEDARNFLVNYQGLNGAEKRKGPDGVLDYFNKVRCVQFDPLDVVGRNADLVFLTSPLGLYLCLNWSSPGAASSCAKRSRQAGGLSWTGESGSIQGTTCQLPSNYLTWAARPSSPP